MKEKNPTIPGTRLENIDRMLTCSKYQRNEIKDNRFNKSRFSEQ